MNIDKIHLTVAAVIEHNNKFLFVEEICHGETVINQPAGHVENGESLIAAAIRETFEETGWQIAVDSLIGIYRWMHPASSETYFRIAFAGTAIEHFPDHPLDDGIMRCFWLSADELQQQPERLRSPLVLRAVQDYLTQIRHPLDLLVNL